MLGHYVYAVVRNDTGFIATPRYVSPRYYKSSKTCKLRFYYHMNGTFYSLLSAHILRNSLLTYLWSDRTRYSDEWKNATVELPACLTDFQVCTMNLAFFTHCRMQMLEYFFVYMLELEVNFF